MPNWLFSFFFLDDNIIATRCIFVKLRWQKCDDDVKEDVLQIKNYCHVHKIFNFFPIVTKSSYFSSEHLDLSCTFTRILHF